MLLRCDVDGLLLPCAGVACGGGGDMRGAGMVPETMWVATVGEWYS